MRNLKVVVISPGLISDYLLNRNDFISPFNLEAEFRLLHQIICNTKLILIMLKLLDTLKNLT
mgnify:CR=1 FL=1